MRYGDYTSAILALEMYSMLLAYTPAIHGTKLKLTNKRTKYM